MAELNEDGIPNEPLLNVDVGSIEVEDANSLELGHALANRGGVPHERRKAGMANYALSSA
jgi:hypothetical protein